MRVTTYVIISWMHALSVSVIVIILICASLALFLLPPIALPLLIAEAVVVGIAYVLDTLGNASAKSRVRSGRCPVCRGTLVTVNEGRLVCEECDREWLENGARARKRRFCNTGKRSER